MKKLFLIIMAVAFLSSCKKEEDTLTKSSYLPMEIGNYWIYQEFTIDTLGIESTRPSFDSVIIRSDTIVNNKNYYVFESTSFYYTSTGNQHHLSYPNINMYRDSSGYVVDQNGNVRFTADNFTDTSVYHPYGDSVSTTITHVYQMDNISHTITVPAGTFKALNYQGTVYTTINTPGVKYPRNSNNYYTEGVGEILHTYFYVFSPNIIEQRLLRYYVKK